MIYIFFGSLPEYFIPRLCIKIFPAPSQTFQLERKQFPQHCHGDAADVIHHLLGESCHYPRAGLISHAPEDLGAGLLLQWVEGGLHGQGEGSKQVPPGGARHVLEIEETFILNVPIWWPGVSQDSILWKTTRAVPPSFSLATARCSWLEQFPASHVTGQICTTFCLVCSYEFSIHTQLLLLRAYSKSCRYYTTKPTLRWSRSKSDSGPAEAYTRLYCPEDALATTIGGMIKKCVKLPLRRTVLLTAV